MTEDEYKRLPGSAGRPIYDEDDHRCGTVDDPHTDDSRKVYGSPKYDTVREAPDMVDALMCIEDPKLEFRGGVRFKKEDDVVSVIAYFWKLRRD